jgi:hypothetical protein
VNSVTGILKAHFSCFEKPEDQEEYRGVHIEQSIDMQVYLNTSEDISSKTQGIQLHGIYSWVTYCLNPLGKRRRREER